MRWAVAEGKLPQGLTLSEDGALAGTPTEAGALSVVVQAGDGKQTSEMQISLRVAKQ